MKKVIAEIDKIAEYIEDFGEPWTFQIVWKLDKIAQQLEELSKASPLKKVSSDVLNCYLDRMIFLSQNRDDLINLIKEQDTKNASVIYDKLKIKFGKLEKNDSIEFIKKVIESSK